MSICRRGLRALLTFKYPTLYAYGPRRPKPSIPITSVSRSRKLSTTTPFVKLDSSRKIEEEELPEYIAEDFYPVYIGDVLASKYRIVAKLGFGSTSTIWLCRDVQSHQYYTLKVCTRGRRPDRELTASEHLNNSGDHFGKKLVRLVLDSFELDGPHGKHTCLIYKPLGMSFTEFQSMSDGKALPKAFIQRSVQLTLISLAFMHENNVIHTDISSNNLLQGIEDTSMLAQLEEDEKRRPVARKVLDDRHVYYSRPMPTATGLPVLSDLGEARIGPQNHRGDIMPGIYRAPEVILGMEWDSKVDIWSMGTMIWDLAERSHLFFAKKNRVLNDEQHLAEMVSLMGPPPAQFLRRSQKSNEYWGSQGNWKGSIPIPKQSFEIRESRFSGEDRELFLGFLRRVLRWLPEERPTAEELAYDDFLMQEILRARNSV
ncbi:protein kinase, putative [Trichophyton benhamiae CBS 112371]|uniref:Protein kinase, putative n=1 Tax=Arthroderma benhamiae (strain ATCC MYA-4681 / CBS 112371) TaxID=663331 RepID=D4AVI4_ARTBC|nr:protein kinase, putative [Trichophyton benhamiae CBS 112371]EFE32740.1 protein kinase, putative [Trichophyton benhamiae CBS 112371]